MPVNEQQDPAHRTSSTPQAATGQRASSDPITDPAHMLPERASAGSGGSKRGSIVRTIVILLVIGLIVAFIVWRILSNKKSQEAEADKAAAAANRPIPVQVANVQQQTVPVYLTALGTVTAYNTVTLHTRVDGQLMQVNFREGQAVRKGQLLLQIDPRPYQAAVDQAVGTLAKDEANLKNMQAEAERYTALYQAGVVSKEQQQLEISNQGQAAGSIKSDQAAIEAAKVNLGYTRIVSPIDGVVGLRQVDPGNIVHAADTTGLLVITQIHPMAIIFTLPEDQLPQVQAAMKTGNKLVVEAYDRSDAHKIATGTLLTIDNEIDTTTGTAKLKAVFDNTDNALFANQFVNVQLVLRQRPNATVIPTAAIQSGAQGNYVFVVNPGPTPAGKRKNQPGANGASGSTGHHGGGKSQGASESTASAGTDNAGASGASGSTGSTHSGHGGKGGGGDSCPAGPSHADAVTVHVDMTIGTNSVLADGELKASQKVVIDGAEKLVDGGNVCPQQAKNNGANVAPKNSGVGAGASSTTGSSSNTSGSPAPSPNASGNGAGSGNGGGHQ